MLDLEDLASHRGSVLGNLPEQAQPAQKMFDSLVWDALRKLDSDRIVYVEAESRKIGQLQVPDALLARMRDPATPAREVRLDPELMVRGSTGPAKADGRPVA